MTQLNINGTEYPVASRDKYKCYTTDLGEDIRMISSRLVTEVRATIVVIEYAYDKFGDDLMKKSLADLRGRADLNVRYLNADGETKQGVFRCTKKPAPTFAFADDGKGRWHNVAFTLEEVKGK